MTPPRNLLVFSREYPPVTVGGTSTVARNLSAGLAALGWRVRVVSTQPDGTQERIDDVDGVTVHRVASRLVYNTRTGVADDSVLVHRQLHKGATALVRQDGPPDVVAMPDLFCYPEAALFARAHRVPLVNVLLQDFHTLTAYDRTTHQVTTGVSADAGHLYALEEKALTGCDHTVFISHALSSAIRGHYPGREIPGTVVHLGVDDQEIAAVTRDQAGRRAAQARLPDGVAGNPLIVACGRLVPVKGFTQLLTALSLLEDAPGRASHLALVGVGPEGPLLARHARARGIEDRVTFVGDVPRSTALSLMSLATVAVVPSLWESFCYVCAEMMALGRPVVATTVDSLNELMPTDRYGYRVQVDGPPLSRELDPRQLADAVTRALGDPREAAERGRQARTRVLDEFTNRRFAERMSALFTDLIARKRNG